MDSLKVALISEEFPPFMFGGIGTVCYDLAYSLSKKKVFTTVFSAKSSKMSKQRVNDYLEVVRLPCFDFPPRFFWFQLRNFSRISRELRDHMLIHAVSPQVSPLCVYLKKRVNRPLVTSHHGVPIYELKAFIDSPISSWTFGDFGCHVLEYPLNGNFSLMSLTHSDHVVSCSHVTHNELMTCDKDLDPRKFSVIYNGINFDEIERIENNLVETENGNNLTLIYYGRLYWLKGITYLIKAFKFLIGDYPNLSLKIFGKGPLKGQIEALISDLGLRGKIHVLGHIPRAKLLMEIMKADVAVLPSIREAQPISVLEAMACKKPVVVFSFPFVSEYIKDSYNGLLAKAKDPKDLASKVSTLLSDKKFRRGLGQNAYKYVKQHHNWDNLVDKYIEVYKKVADLS